MSIGTPSSATKSKDMGDCPAAVARIVQIQPSLPEHQDGMVQIHSSLVVGVNWRVVGSVLPASTTVTAVQVHLRTNGQTGMPVREPG